MKSINVKFEFRANRIFKFSMRIFDALSFKHQDREFTSTTYCPHITANLVFSHVFNVKPFQLTAYDLCFCLFNIPLITVSEKFCFSSIFHRNYSLNLINS